MKVQKAMKVMKKQAMKDMVARKQPTVSVVVGSRIFNVPKDMFDELLLEWQDMRDMNKSYKARCQSLSKSLIPFH